jgi:hypothetical protein
MIVRKSEKVCYTIEGINGSLELTEDEVRSLYRTLSAELSTPAQPSHKSFDSQKAFDLLKFRI